MSGEQKIHLRLSGQVAVKSSNTSAAVLIRQIMQHAQAQVLDLREKDLLAALAQ
jgi:hypothetical protein